MEAAARRRSEGVVVSPARNVGSSMGRAEVPLPVVVWSHPTPGPCVAITANVHGDEVVGVAATHELDDQLATSLRCGTVVLYPSLNPKGLAVQSRVHPDDGVDLNRVFPGEARGGPSARTAHAIFQDLAQRRPELVVDLHSDSATSVPYVLVDRATSHTGARRADLEQRMATLARASGLFVLLEYPAEEYIRFRLDRSLAGAVVNHLGVPALTFEVGARRSVDPSSVREVVRALERVLAHLGLVDAPPGEAPRTPSVWRRMAAPRAQSAGLFEPRLRPGDSFVTGEVLGTVRGTDGGIREVMRAEVSGCVISWTEQPWLELRAVPGTLAVVE